MPNQPRLWLTPPKQPSANPLVAPGHVSLVDPANVAISLVAQAPPRFRLPAEQVLWVHGESRFRVGEKALLLYRKHHLPRQYNGPEMLTELKATPAKQWTLSLLRKLP